MKVSKKQIGYLAQQIINEMVADDPVIKKINSLQNVIGNVLLTLQRVDIFSYEDDKKQCLEHLKAVQEILLTERTRRKNRSMGVYR